MNDQLNETLLGWVDALNGPLWDFLVVFLVAVGILLYDHDRCSTDPFILAQYQSHET
jgi:hypothetical protein